MENNITVSEARQQYRENGGRVMGEESGFVVLRKINKVYDNRVQAVYDFDLSIDKNEFIVLVGPSGCGKSTTLRMIAGLEEITSGYLYIDGVLANHLESKDRDIAMVFQSYALYPNMTVYDNIGFGLAVRHIPKEEIKRRVFEAAEILDLGSYLDRRPRELSGGQMQRVALGRAIVRDAKLFLMDEPLSNLDAKLRVQMRSEIVKLHKRISATTVYVTHDQTEAMTMADRIVVMNGGFVQQVGTPSEIYNEPANVFVATFIGSPPMNMLRVCMTNGTIPNGKEDVPLPDGSEGAFRAFLSERLAEFTALSENCLALGGLRERAAALESGIRTADETEAQALCKALSALGEREPDFRLAEGAAELSEAFARGDRRTAKKVLRNLKKQLDEADFTVAARLKQVNSAEAFLKKEETAPEGKKKRRAEKHDLHAENLQKLEKYLAAYREAKEKGELFVGVRPEHIRLCEEGEKGDSFTAVADFVELLGSELCVYFNAFGGRLICKLDAGKLIRMGDEVRFRFVTDKLKLFDCVGGMRIK